MEVKELETKIKELKETEKEKTEIIEKINQAFKKADAEYESVKQQVVYLMYSRNKNIEKSEKHSFLNITEENEENFGNLLAMAPIYYFMQSFKTPKETPKFMGKVANFLKSAGWFLLGTVSIVTIIPIISSVVCLSYHKVAEVVYKNKAKALDKKISNIKVPENQPSYDELLNLRNELEEQYNELCESRTKVIVQRFKLEDELKSKLEDELKSKLENETNKSESNIINPSMNKSNKKSAVIEEEVEK